MLTLGIITAFVAVFVVVAVWFDYSRERTRLRRTLRGVSDDALGSTLIDVRDRELASPLLTRVVIPAMRGAGNFARRFTPLDVIARLEQDLVLAGNPPGWDAERILAFKILLPIGFAIVGVLVVAALDLSGLLSIAFVALFSAAGYYAPEWILRSRVDTRQRSIRRTLPDSLDLLSITVEAGLSFDAALTRVARNIKGPLGEELYRVVQETQLGKGRGEALRDLGDRTNVDDLRGFVLAMVQAEVFGIPIARVLEVQASEMRLRKRQRAEEEAQKLPVKIVFPLILGIFPAIFVVLLGPAMLQIYDALVRGV